MITGNFKLFPIDAFDSKEGISPWVMPGVGTRTGEENSLVEAEVWVDQNGILLTRFSSCGYFLYFEIKESSGYPITDDMQGAVEDFIFEMLETWLAHGVEEDLECDSIF